jgi:DNA-binding transcriptional LysR family regulator
MQPPGSPMRSLIEQEFREHSLPLPRGLIETGSILTTINLVRSSNMVGVIPRTVADLHAAHGMLHILPYQTRRSLEAYGSLVRKDGPSAARHRCSWICCTVTMQRPEQGPGLRKVDSAQGPAGTGRAAPMSRLKSANNLLTVHI